MSRVNSGYWEHFVPVRRRDLTVQDFVELISLRGRQKYSYDGNGSGCLFWTTTLLRDYVQLEWMGANAVNDFKGFIEDLRQEEAGKHWIPEDEGTFFS